MCKFNNRLFVFILFIAFSEAAPGFPLNDVFQSYDDYDYDIHFDQRQNGSENYRVNLNGFLIAFPAGGENDGNNYTEELLNLLGGDLIGLVENSESSRQESTSEKNSSNQNETADKSETVLNPSDRSSGSADTILHGNVPHKKRRTKFQLKNLLKLFRRNDE